MAFYNSLRWRKDENTPLWYDQSDTREMQMIPQDTPHSRSLSSNFLLADVLERYPSAAQVFFSHHMGCVGCQMNKFETVADAAQIYGLSLDNFLNELRQAIQMDRFSSTTG
jgi:hybrid cluster-associated redox disulfide protein